MIVLSERRMTNGPPSTWFDSLPDEVLQQILYYVPARDILLNIRRISKRLGRLSSEPLLWRYRCRMDFQYWDPKHRIKQKFRGNVGDVDWNVLYLHRLQVASRTSKILDSILDGQVGRIEKFQDIAEFGYDAKDTLLKHCQADHGADDVLARRYYSNAVLDHLHRAEALAEWIKLSGGGKVPLERALSCFDLFILHDKRGDLLEIAEMFDDLVEDLKRETPNLGEMSTREKALTTVAFLRAHNLTGIAADLAYHDLQNNYISIALQDETHPSLPLISAAIFCAVAQRIGLDAHCADIPTHVHVILYPDLRQTVDGRPVPEGETGEPMFLDPFRTSAEVPVQHLKSLLTSWGVMAEDFGHFLTHASARKLVLRTSRNILATVQEFRGHGGTNTGHPTIQLHGNPFVDLENAFYSALWANFMLGTPMPRDAHTQRHYIPMILERFERYYPMDASLIERYICTPFDSSAGGELIQLYETLRVIRQGDLIPKPIHSRNTDGCRNIQYRVGQVFRHRRYGYTAVIIGWDKECGMNSDWRLQNQVQSLSRGVNQSFYHALVEDMSIRYVAEDNVEVIKPTMPTSLMSLAGQYFKRWDPKNHMFVSNIRDEYPED